MTRTVHGTISLGGLTKNQDRKKTDINPLSPMPKSDAVLSCTSAFHSDCRHTGATLRKWSVVLAVGRKYVPAV